MRKDWRENMVNPPNNCLWIQSIISDDLYRWETECGKTFDETTLTPDDYFDQEEWKYERCSSCGGYIHMKTKEYWGWEIVGTGRYDVEVEA